MAKIFYKIANSLVNLVVLCLILLSAVYALYALWDNNQIYSAAENVQAEMQKLKPRMEEGEERASFADLLAVNSDVCAWVSLNDTSIDYPVLQGEDNLTYFNQDVYGNFSLAGSIYLDSRNQVDFSDAYNLLYGHHVEKGRMFGDLQRYLEPAYFKEHLLGQLILPEKAYHLEVLASFSVPASENRIFNIGHWKNSLEGFIPFMEESAELLNNPALARLKKAENPQIIAFTTCSQAFTDARTIVLARMIPLR